MTVDTMKVKKDQKRKNQGDEKVKGNKKKPKLDKEVQKENGEVKKKKVGEKGKKKAKVENGEVKKKEVGEKGKKKAKLEKGGQKENGEGKKKKLKEKMEAKQKNLKAGKKEVKDKTESKIEGRKKQKELKEKRQKKTKSEDVYTLGVEAKKIWEEIRREDCKNKEELAQKLHKLIEGKVVKLVFAHDTVRVLECLIASAGENVRKLLFEEAKDQIILMAKSQYACFFVMKLLKCGSKEERSAIFSTFEGQIAPLCKHKMASNVIEGIYNEYATQAQRNRMLQEFCGPEFRVFKEEDLRTVKQMIEKFPEKKKQILQYLGENVQVLIKKGCYNHSLVHTVIYNYLANCDAKALSDTIELLR